jgi:hypothetical protein
MTSFYKKIRVVRIQVQKILRRIYTEVCQSMLDISHKMAYLLLEEFYKRIVSITQILDTARFILNCFFGTILTFHRL